MMITLTSSVRGLQIVEKTVFRMDFSVLETQIINLKMFNDW